MGWILLFARFCLPVVVAWYWFVIAVTIACMVCLLCCFVIIMVCVCFVCLGVDGLVCIWFLVFWVVLYL